MHLCFLGAATHIILQEQMANLKISQRREYDSQEAAVGHGCSMCDASKKPTREFPLAGSVRDRAPSRANATNSTQPSCLSLAQRRHSRELFSLQSPVMVKSRSASLLLTPPADSTECSQPSFLLTPPAGGAVCHSSASASTPSAFSFPSLLVSLPLLAFPCPTNPQKMVS